VVSSGEADLQSIHAAAGTELEIDQPQLGSPQKHDVALAR
jgi:hypothetical protein